MPPDIEELRKKIIVVYSPGGGNGKSEIAANIACCLARAGLRTWVLDANLYAPTLDLIFGLSEGSATFSEFLISPSGGKIPAHDISGQIPDLAKGSLFLTPSARENRSVRFTLKEKLNAGAEFLEDLPASVLGRMRDLRADVLIIDTYPGFEQINEVWMGLTGHLLVISRLNEIDVKNVRMLLREEDVEDIVQKLIVFNNIRVGKDRIARQAVKNENVPARIQQLKRDAEFQIRNGDCGSCGEPLSGQVEMYSEAILYSEQLSLFRQSLKREGLFVEKFPSDPFSESIGRLAGYLQQCWLK